MGCSQAVRHEILILACVGSSPATPAKKNCCPFGNFFCRQKKYSLLRAQFFFFAPNVLTFVRSANSLAKRSLTENKSIKYTNLQKIIYLSLIIHFSLFIVHSPISFKKTFCKTLYKFKNMMYISKVFVNWGVAKR